jgi:hypothetical protein
VRLAFVLRLCAKFCSFAHFDGAFARSSSLTKVATSLPYALRRRRADQVFQVFLYEGCAVLGQSILAASPGRREISRMWPSTISSRTFRNHEKKSCSKITAISVGLYFLASYREISIGSRRALLHNRVSPISNMTRRDRSILERRPSREHKSSSWQPSRQRRQPRRGYT